jgi:hypothetical protein
MNNNSEVAGSIIALVVAISVFIAWAGIADSRCKAQYGDDAALHPTKLLNECAVNGQIKPLE